MGTSPSSADFNAYLLIDRLSEQTSLRLPAQLSRDKEPITAEKRSSYLRTLLTHDPGVFLERHGDELLATELEYFQPLRSTSYEVDFYMKLLEDTKTTKTAAAPTSRGTSAAAKTTAAKNRRLCKLEMLEKEGYFKMKAMRSREPYLHHLYIGQYTSSTQQEASLEEENSELLARGLASTSEQRAAIAAAPVPAAQFSAHLAKNIMHKHDELELMLRREAERQSYALQEEEEETESEDENDGKEESEAVAKGGGQKPHNKEFLPGEWPAPEQLTQEQRLENEEAFLDIMKQKFLSGQDTTINYASIDADTSLDDHFADLERQNAEDAYFESSD